MLIFLVLIALAAYYAAERNRTLRLRAKARRFLASIERTEALCDAQEDRQSGYAVDRLFARNQ